MRECTLHLPGNKLSWTKCASFIMVGWNATWGKPPRGHHKCNAKHTLIARFMGPTWGPPGSCRPKMGPSRPHGDLLSGKMLTKMLTVHMHAFQWCHMSVKTWQTTGTTTVVGFCFVLFCFFNNLPGLTKINHKCYTNRRWSGMLWQCDITVMRTPKIPWRWNQPNCSFN